jgi:hypothetical protein
MGLLLRQTGALKHARTSVQISTEFLVCCGDIVMSPSGSVRTCGSLSLFLCLEQRLFCTSDDRGDRVRRPADHGGPSSALIPDCERVLRPPEDRSVCVVAHAAIRFRARKPTFRVDARRHLSASPLIRGRRARYVALARHELWWRIRCQPGRCYSFLEIAGWFRRDHSAIFHGVAAHERRLLADEQVF